MTRSNMVYIFFTWNAFGLCLYEWYKGRKTDPEWNKMSGTQKYISMTQSPDSELHVVKIGGFRKESVEDMPAEKYCTPSTSN